MESMRPMTRNGLSDMRYLYCDLFSGRSTCSTLKYVPESKVFSFFLAVWVIIQSKERYIRTSGYICRCEGTYICQDTYTDVRICTF